MTSYQPFTVTVSLHFGVIVRYWSKSYFNPPHLYLWPRWEYIINFAEYQKSRVHELSCSVIVWWYD